MLMNKILVLLRASLVAFFVLAGLVIICGWIKDVHPLAGGCLWVLAGIFLLDGSNKTNKF